MKTIENVRRELKERSQVFNDAKERTEDQKKRIYDIMEARIDKITHEYNQYKNLSKVELEMKENIIERQNTIIADLKIEMKGVKTMLEVPRFRHELKNHDFKGMNFFNFTQTYGQVFSEILDKVPKNLKINMSDGKYHPPTARERKDLERKTCYSNQPKFRIDGVINEQSQLDENERLSIKPTLQQQPETNKPIFDESKNSAAAMTQTSWKQSLLKT